MAGEELGPPQAQVEASLLGHLGIVITEASGTRVVATMPVEPRVHQPFGLLHGGASVVLAESAASLGAHLNVSARGMTAVGLEINANHLRGVRSGTVTATATPLHQGGSTEVWQIEIVDDAGRRVCVSRCTLAIIPQRGGAAGEGSSSTPENPGTPISKP